MKKILVVGAGPAGAITAGLLAKRGYQVDLFESSRAPVRKICGEFLNPQGVLLAQKIGVQSLIKQIGTPIEGMKIFLPKQEMISGYFPQSRESPGLSLNRKDLDEVLQRWAVSQGVKLHLGTLVNQVTFQKSENEEGQSIRLKVSAVDPSGEKSSGAWEVVGDFLVGADGRHSVVSKVLENTKTPRKIFAKRVALHCLVPAEGWEGPYLGEMHLFKDGSYIGLNPISPDLKGKSEWNVSLVTNGKRVPTLGGVENTLLHYINLSENLAPRFKNKILAQKILVTSPVHHNVDSVVPAERVVLVGDAAGFLDPLTGEGMYNAFLSAKFLAEAFEEMQTDTSDLKFKRVQIAYQKKYWKHLKAKKIFNLGLQFLIRSPFLITLLKPLFLNSNRRTEVLLAAIGNRVTPLQATLNILGLGVKPEVKI